MITLLGTAKQYQLESVYEKLRMLGHEVILVDFLKNSSIIMTLDGDEVNITCDGISLNKTKLIYHDPKYLIQHFGHTTEWAERYINRNGWKNTNNNIFEVLNAEKLNSLSVIYPFFAKLNQLSVAITVGLKVPPYILSNDKNALKDFAYKHRSVVTKDIGNATVPVVVPEVSQRLIMTSPVSIEMIEASDPKQPFPILLQKNIEKSLEYRIVVAGEKILAFKVDPNQHPIMQQDYRRGGYMVKYELSKIPPDITLKIFSLHKKLGLFSGSYDFIEATNGEFYFLEVNPAGVWAYIDQVSDGIISNMFSEEISRIYKDIKS